MYNYDPASRKDDLVDMVEKALSTILAVVRLDIAAIVNAFQWCESIYLSCSIFIRSMINF